VFVKLKDNKIVSGFSQTQHNKHNNILLCFTETTNYFVVF